MVQMSFVAIKTESILFANIELVLRRGSQLITINKHRQPENLQESLCCKGVGTRECFFTETKEGALLNFTHVWSVENYICSGKSKIIYQH